MDDELTRLRIVLVLLIVVTGIIAGILLVDRYTAQLDAIFFPGLQQAATTPPPVQSLIQQAPTPTVFIVKRIEVEYDYLPASSGSLILEPMQIEGSTVAGAPAGKQAVISYSYSNDTALGEYAEGTKVPTVEISWGVSKRCGITVEELIAITKQVARELGVDIKTALALIMSESEFRHYITNDGITCGLMYNASGDYCYNQMNITVWHKHYSPEDLWLASDCAFAGLTLLKNRYSHYVGRDRAGDEFTVWDLAVAAYKGTEIACATGDRSQGTHKDCYIVRGGSKWLNYKIFKDHYDAGGALLEMQDGSMKWVSW
jgi:hypothetical protein